MQTARWMLVCLALAPFPPALAQVRVRTQPARPVVGATQPVLPVASPAWQPMAAAPVPLSLGPADRIVVQGLHSRFALGRAGAIWRRWEIERQCSAICYPMQKKEPNGQCCVWKQGPVNDFPAAVSLGALMNLAGPGPSAIYSLQEIGTLASPASGGPGLVQLGHQKGLTLPLAGGRVLVAAVVGWGAMYWELRAPGASNLIERWPAGALMTDQSQRLVLFTRLGEHQADNYGVPASLLAGLK
jgi:hypothetical protein